MHCMSATSIIVLKQLNMNHQSSWTVYRPVCEVHGLLPLSFLDDDEEEEVDEHQPFPSFSQVDNLLVGVTAVEVTIWWGYLVIFVN